MTPLPDNVRQIRTPVEDDERDLRFLHAVFCQVGMPRAPLEARHFTRANGGVGLVMQAGTWFNGTETVEMPLPSGVKPRLVMVHLCSEAIRSKSRNVDIGNSVRSFLMRLGIDTGGNELKKFKREMLALSACRMTMTVPKDGRVVVHKVDPIESFDAWLVVDGSQGAFWPGRLELSQRFFDTLTEHAVPLDANAIATIKHSALAIDAYTWLAHRLCRVRSDAGVRLSWDNLKAQFGQEYRDAKDFRKRFLGGLKLALAAYPDAKVDMVRGGLLLKPSPPPIRKASVVVQLPGPSAPLAGELSAPATVLAAKGKATPRPAQVARFITEDALDRIRDVAPGWDRQWLLARYKEWTASKPEPENPDAAFIGWVKRFTKGKVPT